MCAHPHHSSSMHRTPTPTSRWNEKDPAVCTPTASHNVSNPHFFLFLCLLILMILALHHCLLGCLFLRRTRNQLRPMFLCLYANDYRERQDSRTTACTFPCRCITKFRVGKQPKSSSEWLLSGHVHRLLAVLKP
jgi:hypothetical protein